MEHSRKTKVAMMAATSLLAAAAAMGPALAGDFDQAAYPVVVEAPLTPDIAHAAEHADQNSQPAAKRWALMVIAAGALAGLVRLIGVKKLFRAVSTGAAVAAKATAKAGANAVRAVGRVAGSPLRFAVLMVGLALFALTGVSLLDIEWVGGLITGGVMAAIAAYGVMKTRHALRLRPVKASAQRSDVTEINQ